MSYLCSEEANANSGGPEGPAVQPPHGGPSCPETVTADFKGAVDIIDYHVSINNSTVSNDPDFTMCDGDTLEVKGSEALFVNHPLKIWKGLSPIHENTGTITLYEGIYTYKCGKASYDDWEDHCLPSSNSHCTCGSRGPAYVEPHPCDYIDCGPFKKKSPPPPRDTITRWNSAADLLRGGA